MYRYIDLPVPEVEVGGGGGQVQPRLSPVGAGHGERGHGPGLQLAAHNKH